MRIQLITFLGCANATAARELLSRVLASTGAGAAFEELDTQAPDGARPRHLVGPVHADDQERLPHGRPSKVGQRVDRRVVGALEIVEDDRQGLRPGELDHKPAHGVTGRARVAARRRLGRRRNRSARGN